MNDYTHTKRKDSITVTQIKDNQFLIEGCFKSARVGYVSEPLISYADLGGGPYLELGKDFFGKGRISEIDILNQNIHTGYIILKITI